MPANSSSSPPSRPFETRRFSASISIPCATLKWVVYAKPPFAGPQQMVDYVGRYTHRVAISNHRMLEIEDGQVKFHWRDYRDHSQQKIMTLSAEEFIRRFLLHVLPSGFHRIRYYGFLGNRYRKQKLEQCRQLLGMTATHPSSSQSKPDEDYRDRYEKLTGHSLRQCPVCHRGRMITVQLLPKVHSPPTIPDPLWLIPVRLQIDGCSRTRCHRVGGIVLSYRHSHRPAIIQAPPILPYSCWPKPMNTVHRVVPIHYLHLSPNLKLPLAIQNP